MEKSMGVYAGDREKPQSIEDKWRSDAENKVAKEITPFTYPPFANKNAKKFVVITCVLGIILGLILLSVISPLFPGYDKFMEGMSAEVITEEHDAAAVQILISYGIGLAIVIAVTVGAAVLVHKIKTNSARKEYESEKSQAYARWESEKTGRINAILYEKVFDICPFCGRKLAHVYEKPKDKGFYETVYDVTASGYGTATVTPRSVKHEYIDYTGAFNRYSCTDCYFSVQNNLTTNYTDSSFTTDIDIWKDSKVTYDEVKGTLLYSFMKESFGLTGTW